ncbi:MAG: NADH-quinone oxidoreductase subunit J [Acidobacteria bacterium]|nr:NADH-quinone oxidoreductase subunit J [Acidobacteriota bacterium]
MTFSPNDPVFFITLVLMTLCALWAVMATDILKSALALALTSVFLSIAMFMLDSPLAAVFELSVCAGLITVVFISAISMIKPEGHDRGEDLSFRRNRRLKKYIALPVLLIVASILLWFNRFELPAFPITDALPLKLSEVMWDERRADLAGQAIMILVGVFGVVVLFKEYLKRKERGE